MAHCKDGLSQLKLATSVILDDPDIGGINARTGENARKFRQTVFGTSKRTALAVMLLSTITWIHGQIVIAESLFWSHAP